MKDTLTEMKNNLQGINNRVDKTKNQISDLEYEETKHAQSEQQKKKEDNIRSLWDNFRHTNIRIMGLPEGEASKELKTYLKIMTEKFHHLLKTIVMQAQEVQRDPHQDTS